MIFSNFLKKFFRTQNSKFEEPTESDYHNFLAISSDGTPKYNSYSPKASNSNDYITLLHIFYKILNKS